MSLEVIMFFVLGALAIAAAVVTVSSKNPVISAMGLVVHFFMLAGLYLNLQAQFMAVLQVLVYAGAIMVLVIFVIMLLNLGDEEQLKEKLNARKFVAILFGGILIIQFAMLFMITNNQSKSVVVSNVGTVEAIGNDLFNNYLFPFEAISLLLLGAIIGSVILAKRKID